MYITIYVMAELIFLRTVPSCTGYTYSLFNEVIT